MRKSGKRLGKKLLGTLLAVSLAAAAVFPMQGVAAEGNESGYEDSEGKILTEDTAAGVSEEGQQAAEGERKQETGKEEQLETEGKEEQPETEGKRKSGIIEEEPQPEEGKTERKILEEPQQPENEGQEAKEDTPGNRNINEMEPEGQETERTEEAEGKTFMLPQENGGEDVVPRTDKYDTERPVIESFEFQENGQALTTSDTLHFTMSAYDADDGIRSVVVDMSCDGQWESVTLKENSGTRNLYEGSLSCSGFKGISGRIYSIRVTDMKGNYTDWETWENGKYRYTFTLNNEVVKDDISVSNFQMQTNPSNEDGKLRINDTVTYTADIACEGVEIQSVYMYLYSSANGAGRSSSVKMDYNADAQKLTGTYTVTDKTYPSQWRLNYIRVYTKTGRYYSFYPQNIEPDTDVKFTVVQENFDTEKPVIEDISIDKNGQWVKAGETVTVKVKVKEENPSSAYMYITPQVAYVSVNTYVGLNYDGDTSEYVGTIKITEDTYPCEWALTSLTVRDQVGHSTYLSDFKSDYYDTYPWYYKVKSGNTYREDKKDVTFNFYGLVKQEDGSFKRGSLISSDTVEVGRRGTLKELGIFPEPIEGVNAEWKYKKGYWDEEVIIDEDTEWLFQETAYSITAAYDKGCANVSLTYMSKDSGRKTTCIPIFVDKEAAYKDVLDELKLPEDAQTEEFVKFQLGEYYDENTLVGYICDFSVEAKYNNCQVAWNTRYIDKDGKEATKVVNKSYLEGAGISDALADLGQPEPAKDMEFEAWVLASSDTSQTITQPMANMDVIAVYQGKTTVDAFSTYRGSDGTIATNRKLMFLDGENLTDAEIQGGATEAFKDVNHLKGLRLSEWKGDISLDQGRYKEVQFQALYYNCVVTLKFPDNTCQYIVVDKESSYTLPTEYDKYVDIIWDGYEKGAAITIDKDTEFMVKEWKDRPEEETGGVKLSDEEIVKITEEIKDAEDGETITIDMKKATIIPKEVQEAIQGKAVNIVLKMEGYSWTVNGTDVVATDLKDIDLEVKIDTNAIPSALITAVAEGQPATQISLTHDGEFGFRADLTLNLGSENAGSIGNLYYYDSSGKLIFINAAQIGTDGTTSLPFSHASDYVIVIENKSSDSDKDGNGGQDDKVDGNEGNQDIPIDDNEGNQDIPINDDKNNWNIPIDGSKERQDIQKDKDQKKEDKDNETASVKKNPNNITADSNTAKTDTTDSSKMKSPKTGE